MDRGQFTVAWICALPLVERPAAEAMLDEEYGPLEMIPGDAHTYTLGRIGSHKVVIACMSAGRIGMVSAASVATHLLRTFPHIRLSLMVGIGAGLPNPDTDVRLGDVVVSQPTKGHAGVVQYDMGKAFDEGRFEIRGWVDAPSDVMLQALSKLQSRHIRKEPEFPQYIAQMLHRNPHMAAAFARPDAEDDVRSPDVAKRTMLGDQDSPTHRQPRDAPMAYYGLIASGNQVIASVEKANWIESMIGGEDRVLCLDMEAAGLMNDFRCLIIRGISDYADSLKNDRWRPYAAAAAAAYAKELLNTIPAGRSIDRGIEDSCSRSTMPAAKAAGTVPGSNSFGDTHVSRGTNFQGNFGAVNVS